jgi:hypothetical protein
MCGWLFCDCSVNYGDSVGVSLSYKQGFAVFGVYGEEDNLRITHGYGYDIVNNRLLVEGGVHFLGKIGRWRLGSGFIGECVVNGYPAELSGNCQLKTGLTIIY